MKFEQAHLPYFLLMIAITSTCMYQEQGEIVHCLQEHYQTCQQQEYMDPGLGFQTGLLATRWSCLQNSR